MDWTEKKANPVEIVEKQSAVISIQGGVIADLFRLLSERMDAEEMDALPVVKKINAAAGIREDIERRLYGREAI